MRFNILGFDQEKATKLGLDLNELMILRHLHDFASSGKMEQIIRDNKVYYWVKYDKFVEDLPILNMKKTRIMEIFNNNLCVKPNDWEKRYNSMSTSSQKRANSFKFTGLLESYTKKDATGTYSYFAFTKLFYELLPNITNDDAKIKEDAPEPTSTSPKKTNKTNTSIPKSKDKYAKKTKFHNFHESFTNYSEAELEEIALNQQDKFENKETRKNISEEELKAMAIEQLQKGTFMEVKYDDYWKHQIDDMIIELKKSLK